MFDFILVFVALRKEVIKLVSIYGFEIILAILINYYIDDYYGLKGWSLNDKLTVIFVSIKGIIAIFKKYKKCQN